jgi:hypothetical protein
MAFSLVNMNDESGTDAVESVRYSYYIRIHGDGALSRGKEDVSR